MSLIPIDKSGQVSIYTNNRVGSISEPSALMPSYSPRTEYPVDPRNDLLPPAFTSPMVDMQMGPPEQTTSRYFSLSVDDIDNFQKDKIKKWIKVYEKVLGNCFRRIREHVLRDQKFCFFPVPEYLSGFPLYNITHCTCFIIKKLRENGFKTTFIPPNMVYIYWAVNNHYERVITGGGQKRISSTGTRKALPAPKPKEKDVHYINLNPEPQPSNNYQNQQLQQFNTPNKYSFQKEEQFLFG